MEKEERIKALASDMDYGCTRRDLYPDDAKEIAKTLDILGYRKIVWHKVAEGDLPKEAQNVIVVYNWLDILYYGIAAYDSEVGKWVDGRNPNRGAEVIAWTEFPIYEE